MRHLQINEYIHTLVQKLLRLFHLEYLGPWISREENKINACVCPTKNQLVRGEKKERERELKLEK